MPQPSPFTAPADPFARMPTTTRRTTPTRKPFSAERDPQVTERCTQYVAMLERGHTAAEVAAKFGVATNAVVEVLRRRGLPSTMKAAVRAYWKRADAAQGA